MDRFGEHIDNKFGGCDAPFGGNVSAVKNPEEQYHLFKDTFTPVAAAFQVLSDSIKKIVPVVKLAAEVVADFWKSIKDTYPNKRVVHLATHGKPRVRKKNIRRIMEWVLEAASDGNK